MFVETAEQCTAAATTLGLDDTTPTTLSRSNRPHGCYLLSNFLFFNPDGDRSDTDTLRSSICSLSDIQSLEALAELEGSAVATDNSTASLFEYQRSGLEFRLQLQSWGELFFAGPVFLAEGGFSSDALAWVGMDDPDWVTDLASAMLEGSDGGAAVTVGEVAALNLSRPLSRSDGDSDSVPTALVDLAILRWNSTAATAVGIVLDHPSDGVGALNVTSWAASDNRLEALVGNVTDAPFIVAIEQYAAILEGYGDVTTVDYFRVTSGAAFCKIALNGQCVTDGTNSNYGNNEACTIELQQNGRVSSTEFSTEYGYDHVTIDGTDFTGSTGPDDFTVSPSTTIRWTTDGSGTRAGWTICFSAATASSVAPAATSSTTTTPTSETSPAPTSVPTRTPSTVTLVSTHPPTVGTTSEPSTSERSTLGPTATRTSTPSTIANLLCDPCDDRADIFELETCQYFRSQGSCGEHAGNCGRTCCTELPSPCGDVPPIDSTATPTVAPASLPTSVPTDSTGAPSTTAVLMCDPCDGNSDIYADETCQYFRGQDSCDQHLANCGRTCCVELPAPCAELPAPASTTDDPTTSVPTAPSPTDPAVTCVQNCGQSANGGGTCRANGRCTSCNDNRVLQSGRCYSSIACKGRRIQSGSQFGSSCRCLDDHCHYCNRAATGDVCRVCRDGFYLLDDACVETCPAGSTLLGIGSFKRRCTAPFSCAAGRIQGQNVAYGCKCATDDMAAAACQNCEFRADEFGQHCTRCNGGKFIFESRCQDSCDGTGLIAYNPGNYGRECRAPFTCADRTDEDGNDCKCSRVVGRNNCQACDYDIAGVSCLRCTNSMYLHTGVCVEACPNGTTGVSDDRDGRECI